ncbi:MAG: PAS domain S-box protein [Candidatus Lokiarchaeota archaeon]|nr:PAS domain S-box protein [Candidatus Lokiarchaeota archaeon]
MHEGTSMPKQKPSDESAERYRSILEMANDGIVVIQDDCIAMVNPAFMRMLKYDEDKLLGRPFEDFIDPITRHSFKNVQESFDWGEKERPSFRAHLLDKRRQTLIVEMSTADFFFEGRPAVVGIVRDISEQIKLESAIEDSKARYKSLYESSPIAYFTLSRRGTIQQANSAAQVLLGYSASDLLKRNISSFFPKEEKFHDIAKQILDEALQGKILNDLEMKLVNSEGKHIWVSINSSPLIDDSGSSIGFMALDIDRRKAAEARERMERERANLYLEVMTHDLNNVNQSILFAMGLINETLEIPDQVQRIITEANWNVRRAARMIANMRAIITLRDSPPAIECVDIEPFMKEAITRVKDDFPWKSVKISSDIDPALYEVAGHRFVESIFFNILHNAVMYDTDNDVTVLIHAEDINPDGFVRIVFEDHGPGISDTLKKYIFKRTGHPDAQLVGRGLGLTLVDAIVEHIGGRIWVEDRVEGDHTQGSKFILEIPKWVEKTELPCGRETCITFYKSNHCLFCEPTLEVLQGVLDELTIPHRVVQEINVDDPLAGVSQDELPMLPFIKICDKELTGFVADDQVRSAVMNLLMKPCYPE